MSIFGSIQLLITFIITIAAFAAELFAFIHCLSRPASAFPAAGKRTKTFWLVITGVAALIGLLALPPRGLNFFLALIAAAAAIIYIVDVRPAVGGPRRGGGRPGGSW